MFIDFKVIYECTITGGIYMYILLLLTQKAPQNVKIMLKMSVSLFTYLSQLFVGCGGLELKLS